MSFDTAGRTMMGLTSAGMVELVGSACRRPAARLRRQLRGRGLGPPGARCSALRAAHPASAGHLQGQLPASPSSTTGHIHYDGTPELMADYARPRARLTGRRSSAAAAARRRRTSLAMRAALENTPPGPVPDLDTDRRASRRLLLALRRYFRRAARPRPPPPARLNGAASRDARSATIDATQALLAGADDIAGRGLSTVVFLALKLGRPLFLEGEAGSARPRSRRRSPPRSAAA